MSDFLTPLIDAYRAEHPPHSVDARALRGRILRDAARREQSPARHLKWLVALAATFIGTAALAATPVVRPWVSHLWAHVAVLVTSRTEPPAPAVRRAPLPAPPALTLSPHPDLPRPSPLTASPHSSVTAVAAPEAPAPVGIRAAPSLPARSHVTGRTADAAPAAPETAHSDPVSDGARSAAAARSAEVVRSADQRPPSPTVPRPLAPLAPDLAAYQIAHRFHFTNGDYTRALVAWNGYLARFPNGTFAPEARLNRAVCLARVGRTEEARAQLQSIARGKGSYAPQAQRLLDGMSRRE